MVRRNSRLGLAGLRWVGVLGLLTFALFPCYWMLVSSLRPAPELFTVPPRLLPGTVTIQWYEVVLKATQMPRYFLNSALISTISMIVSLVIATLGAYGLTRFRHAGQRLLLLAVLSSYVLPPVLLLLPLYLTLGKLGLINTYAGVIVTHVTFTAPFCLWLLRSFFQAIPLDLEEAALVDGAGLGRAVCYVVLPLALPGIIAAGIFTFILAWNDFLFALVLITSEELKTLPVGVNDL